MLGRWHHFLLWLTAIILRTRADGIDEQMRILAGDIGDSFTSISKAHNHRVDWMFVVDHGGFNSSDLHLEYSNYFIQQLASHLYISPTYSQAGVLTYGSTTDIQIPLDIQTGNQCDFNTKLRHLRLTLGQSDMNKALVEAVEQLKVRGRDNAHKVTVLITTAGWQNVGRNPYENVAKVKDMGTLIVVVLVFNRAESIVAPVILSFASERPHSLNRAGQPVSIQTRYAFELEAKRGNLRRLYRHFLLATEKMDYKPLQVPSNFCPACADGQACVCDTNLFNTYHCETDTYGPLLTQGCPADVESFIEPGKPYATVSWTPPEAVDFSTSMQSEIITEHEEPSVYQGRFEDPYQYNSTTKQYKAFIGKTLVTHRFFDGSGNSVNCSFQIEVFDNEKPIISNCPQAPISVNTSGHDIQNVYWPAVTASDNSERTPSVLLYVNGFARPESNRTFHIGSSAVRLIYSDKSLNTASCDFTVEVIDNEPPTVLQCDGPGDTIYSNDTQTYVDWAIPQFVDNSKKPVNITSDTKPGYLKIRKHTVTYTAEDIYGNKNYCSFTFTVRGYPCPELPAPYNGAIICDNAVPGAVCQIFCENPYDFEPIVGQPNVPDRYSCVGMGQWFPTDVVPHCVVKQRNKKLTSSYYFDGDCGDYNVSEAIKSDAVNHYAGFVQGGYFKEAWGREIASQDFNNPKCGASVDITTYTRPTIPTSATTPAGVTTPTVPTVTPLTSAATRSTAGSIASSNTTTPAFGSVVVG